MSNGYFAEGTDLEQATVTTDESLFGSRFYIFRSEYRMPVSTQFAAQAPWTDADLASPNSPSSAIFSGSTYYSYDKYYYYDLGDNVDEDTVYEKSTTSDSYTFTVGSGEMTMLGYYEWDISEDGTWEYKCPEGTAVEGYYRSTAPYNQICTEDGDIDSPEVDIETITTAEIIWRYETASNDDVTEPTLTVDADDEELYLISYSETEAAGLKNRFGLGDIVSSLDEINNFFSSSAETLFNTMNVSRFNFQKTNAPEMNNGNLSAIGTVAAGSALMAGASTDSSTDSGGY